MKLYIEQTGILSTGTEAIVNAANTYLAEGGGVCGIIFDAAGSKELTEACNKIGGCKTGSAVITPGFKATKYVIHAVGPVWIDGLHNEPQDLYSCYIRSLDLALENNISSITFPLISAGIFGYPKEKAIRKALEACNDWNNKNSNYDIKVVFAIPGDYEFKLAISIANEIMKKG